MRVFLLRKGIFAHGPNREERMIQFELNMMMPHRASSSFCPIVFDNN